MKNDRAIERSKEKQVDLLRKAASLKAMADRQKETGFYAEGIRNEVRARTLIRTAYQSGGIK